MNMGVTSVGMKFGDRASLKAQLTESLGTKGEIIRETTVGANGRSPQRALFEIKNGRPNKTMLLVAPITADKFKLTQIAAAKQFVGLDRPTRKTAEGTRRSQARSRRAHANT